MDKPEKRTLDEWAEAITYRVCEAIWGGGGLVDDDPRYLAIYKQVYHGVRLAQAEARESAGESGPN